MTTAPTAPAKLPGSANAAIWFADCLRTTLSYGELLAKDIPVEKFHLMPHPTMNHPAFCYGHLAMYPNRALNMIGRSDLIRENDGWSLLFDAPAPCQPQDGRYPSKHEIMEHYVERHRAVLEVLQVPGAVKPEVFQQENPAEGRFKKMFPTIGGAVNFVLSVHHMLHLGQVSAWRRAVGLPPVM